MQLKIISLWAIATVAVSGWQIPKGLPDGLYRVDGNPDGTTNHTLLQTLLQSTLSGTTNIARGINSKKPASRIKRGKRDLTFPESSTCQSYSLPANDNNIAFNGLANMCQFDTGTIDSLGAYFTSNDVVVYWCDYSKTLGHICSAIDESLSIQGILTNDCKAFVAGWVSWIGESYGQDSLSRNINFCGNGIVLG